jgi:hypothetical protein
MIMKRISANVVIIVGLLLIASYCTTTPELETPSQTQIIEVRVAPNPVAVGDTATFTCIIEDSLDERFRFQWGIEGDGSLQDTVTKENIFKWVAPNNPKKYLHTVDVDNGAQDSLPTGKSFTVTVTE